MLARPYTVVTYEFAAGAAQCAIVCACTSRGVGAEQTVYTALFTVESVGGVVAAVTVGGSHVYGSPFSSQRATGAAADAARSGLDGPGRDK